MRYVYSGSVPPKGACMKALLLTKYKHLEIADLPQPIPASDEVLVRVEACGICGSDVHGYDGSSGRRVPPIVMGHEAAGQIAEIGNDVKGYAVGDRVTMDSTIYCSACSYCRNGDVNLCDRRQVLGVSCADYRRAGAFAEFVTVPSRILYRLPDALPFEHAATLEAVSVAVHAVSLSQVAPNSSVLVVGAGMIGLLLLQVLRAEGCSRLFIADLDETRLKLARQLGATAVLSAKNDISSAVLHATEQAGVDLVIEAVGRTETVSASLGSVRKGGTVVLVGNISPQVSLPLQAVVTRQIRLQGSCASAGEYPRAMELLATGTIQVKPLITAVAPLEEGPRWFERLCAGEPNLMKVVLTPGAQL
jgi:L-iditol 2-dehydrogenase